MLRPSSILAGHVPGPGVGPGVFPQQGRGAWSARTFTPCPGLPARFSGLARALCISASFIAAGAWDRACSAGIVADFDDLSLAPDSYWRGPDPNGTVVNGPYGPVVAGSFTSHGVKFDNYSDQTYGSWSGFAYSNTRDTTTPGFGNQFSAATGSGRGPGNDNYGVAFGYDDIAPNNFDPNPFDPSSVTALMRLPHFTLPAGASIAGMYVTNTTYAALSMLLGDSFAKKFGGASGNDADWFKLSAYGIDAFGQPLTTSVDFYLADFRFADNSLDYIVTDWRFMDLSALAGAKSIHFNVSSSDVGPYGLNTPGYFAVDDVQFVNAVQTAPEPSSLALAGIGSGVAGLLALRRRKTA
jgi:hypothetical protein